MLGHYLGHVYHNKDLLVATFGHVPNKRNAVRLTTAWHADSVQ